MSLPTEIFTGSRGYFKCLLNEIFLVLFEMIKITLTADNMNNTEKTVKVKEKKLIPISCNPETSSVNTLGCFSLFFLWILHKKIDCINNFLI